jgi:hypothetical protein
MLGTSHVRNGFPWGFRFGFDLRVNRGGSGRKGGFHLRHPLFELVDPFAERPNQFGLTI